MQINPINLLKPSLNANCGALERKVMDNSSSSNCVDVVPDSLQYLDEVSSAVPYISRIRWPWSTNGEEERV
jgi:hypothetical protein